MARFDFDKEASQAAASKKAEDARVAAIAAAKQKEIDAAAALAAKPKPLTNTQILQAKQAEEIAARKAAAAANPLLNKAVMPTDAPAGQRYVWIGGTTTGSWKLYKDVVTTTFTPSGNPVVTDKYAGSGTAASPFTLNGQAFTGTYGGKKYKDGIIVTDSTTVTETGRVTNDDGTITVTYSDGTTKIITAIPGSGAGALGSDKTLASNVFKNTLALFFGAEEMTKPWADQLYKSVSGFYKTGSTVEEAFNMAVLESQNNPSMTEFTKRFKGIYSLQKMKQMGKAVTVPTIAEYFATESKMGDMLKASNLGEIANEDFLGDVLGKGVSATEFGNRITQIFDRIDNAPQAIKTTLNRFFPYLDRISLAKALALGDKGALQLQQEVAGYEVLAAGESQGLGVSAENPMGLTVARASDIAKSGGTYASTLGQFGQIKKAMPIVSSLEQISKKTDTLGQVGLEKALIGKSAKELSVLEQLTAEEEARYLARSGGIGPRGLASQARGSGGYF